MTLETLFCGTDAARFLAEQFPRDLLVSHGPCSRMGDVAGDSRLSDVREFCKFYGISGSDSAVREASSLRSPGLDALCASIREELGLRPNQIGCSIIYTTDGAGTGKHYDAIEGLTIQMCGRKLWRYQASSQLPQPGRMTTDPSAGRLPDDAKSYTLESGSVAFLPRGWWHDTAALEPAISLHFELRLDTWLNIVLREIHRTLAVSPDYLQPVPMATEAQRDRAASQAVEMMIAAARRIEALDSRSC